MKNKTKAEFFENFREIVYEYENDEPSEIKCQVCLKFTFETDDQIVLCDLCNGAVHQKCYGSPIENELPRSNNLIIKFLIDKFHI